MKYLFLLALTAFTVQAYATQTIVFEATGEFDSAIYPAAASYVFSKDGGPVSVSVYGRRQVCYPDTHPDRNENCVFQTEPIATHQILNLSFVPSVGSKGALVYQGAESEPIICNYKKSFGRLKSTGLCKLDLQNIYDKKKKSQTYQLKYSVQFEN